MGTTSTTRVYYIIIGFGELGKLIFKDLWILFLGYGWPYIFAGHNILGVLNPALSRNHPMLCQLSLTLWFFHEILANTAFIVFESKRVAALYCPFRSRMFFTPSKAIALVMLLAFFSAFLAAQVIGVARIIDLSLLPLRHMCIFSSTVRFWSQVMVAVLFINYVLPAVLSVICSVFISSKIVRRSRHTRNLRVQPIRASSSTLSLREISVLYIRTSLDFALNTLLHLKASFDVHVVT